MLKKILIVLTILLIISVSGFVFIKSANKIKRLLKTQDNIAAIARVEPPQVSQANMESSSSLTFRHVDGERSLEEIPKIEPLTIENIFSENHDWVKDLPAGNRVTMIAPGDIIPGRYVNWQVVSTNNFHWPYAKTAEFLKSADVTFINLEAPLFDGCAPTRTGMVFCGDIRNVWGLKFAGVDVASLANNHAGNHGAAGVEATQKLLTQNGIDTTGVNGPIYKEIKGVKFSFLGFNDVTAPQPGIENAEDNKIRVEIDQARRNSDVVVVSLHAGAEYQAQPDERQKYLAHLIIDSGADLVIGNHPHWIQPMEIYKNKFIMYAHGNFIFDQMWSDKTRQGVVGKYTFYNKKLVDVNFTAIQIYDYAQPNFFPPDGDKPILASLRAESEKLAGIK